MTKNEIKIRLKKSERAFLRTFLKKGTKKAQAIARANILLMADKGLSTTTIAHTIWAHRQSIWRIKKRYSIGGLENALYDKPRSGQPRKYTQKHETEIIALACTTPPKGRKRWTVRLLTKQIKKKKGFKKINRETIRLVLKKRKQNLG